MHSHCPPCLRRTGLLPEHLPHQRALCPLHPFHAAERPVAAPADGNELSADLRGALDQVRSTLPARVQGLPVRALALQGGVRVLAEAQTMVDLCVAPISGAAQHDSICGAARRVGEVVVRMYVHGHNVNVSSAPSVKLIFSFDDRATPAQMLTLIGS